MVDINIGNFLTIGIISVIFYALLRWGLNAAGISMSWLGG